MNWAKRWTVLRRLSVAGCLLLLSAATTGADEASDPAAAAYQQGYDLVLDENWTAAVEVFEKLIAEHGTSDWADDAAFWLCYAQRQLGEPAPQLFECYERFLERHEDSEWADDARRAMVRLAGKLGRDGRPEYQEKVRDFGRGEDEDRMLAVLVALGEIGDERSVEVILKRLQATSDERLRARIVEALDDVQSERAINKLIDLALHDPSLRVRLSSIDVLGDHHVESVQTRVAEALRQIVLDAAQPSAVRAEALDELSDLDPPWLFDLLRQAATSSDEALAYEAIDGLSDHGGEEAIAVLVGLLRESADVGRRVDILDELADSGLDSAVEALYATANSDPDPRIRRAATEALGEAETPAAREALIRLLEEMNQ